MGGGREGVGSVRMVMGSVPLMDSGVTVTQSLINTMYNSRRLLKYMQTIYNTGLGALDKIIVKIHNITEN